MNEAYLSAPDMAQLAAGSIGEIYMRGFSMVLTLAFVLAAPPLAGSSKPGALGVGTFAYGGSPLPGSPSLLTVATR